MMIEYMDVVDVDDNVVGKASKSEIYEKNLRHRIVHVLIYNDKGEMAIQLRSKKVSFCPHHWCTAVGGHVQSGETYEEAAMREYQEELGMTTRIEFFKKDFYKGGGNKDGPKLEKFLTTFRTTFNGPFKPDPEVVERVDFFPIEEMKQMAKRGEKFHPELLFLLEKHVF
ncbi:NUDIX domain-containing protein [Candidatus Woesearchaeota archaeon]|nr:NUDIX domain-containing protein [Candidatus Woesearchaeota archaeon]